MRDSVHRTRLAVGIIDDEDLGRVCVRAALSHLADVEVTCEASSVTEAIGVLAGSRPDLVFLDVRLGDGDGFDVLNSLPPGYTPCIVFVTAYDSHAVAAFELQAVDYVLKPFEDTRIHAAVERARRHLHGERLADGAMKLAALLRAGEHLTADLPRETQRDVGFARRITVRDGERHTYVPLTEVDWFEADSNLVKVHARGATHTIRSTMRDLAAHLDPAVFMRIHRSTIVRIAAVKSIEPWFAGDYVVKLMNGTELRLSRTYRDETLRLFR